MPRFSGFTQSLGVLHQHHLEAQGLRRARGAFYTPDQVVEGLLDIILEPLLRDLAGDVDTIAELRILDPACGSGNFLAGAARRIASALVDAGMSSGPAAKIAFGQCIAGVDIDESAIGLAREALALESGGEVGVRDLESTIIAADALAMEQEMCSPQLFSEPSAPSWPEVMERWGCQGGFDVVIGNPPFLSQLSKSTARTRMESDRARQLFGKAVSALTDSAALFFLLGLSLTRPRGQLCMIQPISFLAARDAAGTRSTLAAAGSITGVWIAEERMFDAAVDVCAIVVAIGVPDSPLQLYRGEEFALHSEINQFEANSSSWARLLALTSGVPQRRLSTSGKIRDIADGTSDFRDFYYGIAPHVVDCIDSDGQTPRVLTVGLIDVARIFWGTRSTRLNRQRFERPCLTLSELAPEIRRRAESLLVPKVVVATQTRTLEGAVDEAGIYVPSVPVVSLIPQSGTVWELAAALNAPPLLLVAAERHSGGALATDALRLSANDCLELPLPADRIAWLESASLFEKATRTQDVDLHRAVLGEYARAASAAYGCADDGELLEWWWNRLTRGRNDSKAGFRTQQGTLEVD